MLKYFLDAIYSEVISASTPGMKTQGAVSSPTASSDITSAAWLPELIETLNHVAELPAPRQTEIDACRAQLHLQSRSNQPTLH